jgi:hypothetical protein
MKKSLYKLKLIYSLSNTDLKTTIMKKLFIFLAIMPITVISFAQGNINRGDWMLGGNAGFESETIKQANLSPHKTTYFILSPNIGYFFIDRLAGGIQLKVRTSNTESTIASLPGESKEIDIEAGPFLRYYLLPSSKKLNIFVDGAYNFGNFKYTPASSGTLVKYKVGEYAIKAGAAYFFIPEVALEFALGYGYRKETYSEPNNYTDTYKGVNFKFGFQIHLAGKGGKAANK